MQVRMIQHIGGFRNGEPWPEAGGLIDVPDHEGADLIGAGYAKAVTDEATPDTPGTGDGEGDQAPTADGDKADATEPIRKPRGTVKKAAPRG